MLPSAFELVARYLRANDYHETLTNFIAEAGLPKDIGARPADSITIESVLHEKQTFDTSLNFEKLGIEDKDHGWLAHAPSKPTILKSLPNQSNILSVSVMELTLSQVDSPRQYCAVTTADRKLHLLDPTSPTYEVARSYSAFSESPILDVIAIDKRRILVASMSGRLALYDTVSDVMLEERKDHSKYVVKIAHYTQDNQVYIATAGWDAKVFLYQYRVAAEEDGAELGEPRAVLELPSIPETLLFIEEDDTPILLVARRDSTFLHYYALPSPMSSAFVCLGKQNLAPHSNAWIAFTPSDIQLCPSNPSLVAIATSTTPHMKLLIVRLLIPSNQTALLDANRELTQASQAQAELLIQDREEAAIVVNVSTLAPQTQYSTPRLVWRPDGSGIYLSSDDGLVRGIEAVTGKLMATLEGHDAGSKIRCLWAGKIKTSSDSGTDIGSQQEFLISGGFDQRLIMWHP
ncbi:WD40-repeat-containing domain protein [Phaeosphaeria sp. MPI-PUGE-AT-0046c]|nr:WD40-repeat-containing domain protein [Phaeosphaeria sp. MPI-PUGE-AT-0046c]